ncbi:uncharacterized protein LOC119998500 [Tripterygium wilfordii]|uniref:uncharacterized protein LOC119998500 n=1 Tax=Tripterygium wilfordii TaxID=458696 RepID=UPI0018F82CC7|nr:uncharacterized protein LOC119998500 [Tripterygium wilfordii]
MRRCITYLFLTLFSRSHCTQREAYLLPPSVFVSFSREQRKIKTMVVGVDYGNDTGEMSSINASAVFSYSRFIDPFPKRLLSNHSSTHIWSSTLVHLGIWQ